MDANAQSVQRVFLGDKRRAQPGSSTHGLLAAIALAALVAGCVGPRLSAQDDVTTQNASSAIDGGWVTGPASNPLSYLNGPAFRTSSIAKRYDFRDFHPASTLDGRLPYWVNLEAEERFRFEAYQNGGFKEGNDDSYFLNRLRLQLDLAPNTWVSFHAQTQDARPFLEKPPIGPPNENRWDLKTAYAEIGDPEKHWISMRVGRQLINYNNTLIANSEWRNQGRSYDAAVTNLNSGPYHLGIFAASAFQVLSSGISHHQAGNNVYGLYGRIDDLLPKSSLEPFVLWRVQPKAVVEAALSTKTGKEGLIAYGLRFKQKLRTAFDYSGEAVLERGSVGTEGIRSWAVTGGASYQFESLRGRPRAFAQYDFASGNPDPASGTHRTFDTIYPTAHDRLGILDLFGWQNIKSIRGGATVMPRSRWSVTGQYLNFWLASAMDAVYNSSGGAIVSAPGGKFGTHIGEEGDVYSWYELNRHLNIGAGMGWFAGGGFLSQSAIGRTYASPYFVINFKDAGKATRNARRQP